MTSRRGRARRAASSCTVTGPGGGRVRGRAPCSSTPARSPRRRSCSTTRAPARCADNVEVVRRRRRAADAGRHRRTGTTTPCTPAPSTPSLGRDATLQARSSVTLGGDLVRLSPTVAYRGPRRRRRAARALLRRRRPAPRAPAVRRPRGAALPQQRASTRARCRATGAHTVWIGDVLIRAAAEGTDTYELNRNLVLTDGARADSVPNLEIETGEIVGAGHASATGRFDDEQLFYLQSRGIPEDEARRLVVRGFFADVISRSASPRSRSGCWPRSTPSSASTATRRPRERRACLRGLPSSTPEVGAAASTSTARRRRRPRRAASLRRRRHLLARRGLAVRGRGRRLHDRVLAARLALRPAHRRAHRPAGHRPGPRLPRRRRRRRRLRRRRRPRERRTA